MMFDKLDKLSAREKGLLILALTCLVAACVNWFAVRPISGLVAEMNEEIRKEKQVLAVGRACEARLAAVSEKYDKVRMLLGQATTTALNDMRGEIDGLARGNSVEVPTMQNRDPVISPSCTEYSIEISGISCTVSNLLGFVNALESSPGMLRVSKLTLSPGKDNTVPEVKGSMTITKIMIAPDEEAAATIPKEQ